VRLVRPGNAVLAAVGVAAGLQLAGGLWPGPVRLHWAAAALAAFCITSFGNVLNDINDRDVDRLAHPTRPLPAGAVSARAAAYFAGLLLALGLAFAALAAGLWTFIFAAANAGLLALYELRLKRTGFAGNVLVAGLTGSTFLFGAVATGQPWAEWGLATVAAGMAFFANLAREVAKDIEDVDADRGHRRTLPMLVGARNAGFMASAFAIVSLAASWPFFAADQKMQSFCGSGPSIALGFVVVADLAVLSGAVLAPMRPGFAQRALKVGMAGALLGFLGWGALRAHCYT
jgi:geranylgeranylglycerol-phosphate geranylgeranyltransferase